MAHESVRRACFSKIARSGAPHVILFNAKGDRPALNVPVKLARTLLPSRSDFVDGAPDVVASHFRGAIQVSSLIQYNAAEWPAAFRIIVIEAM